MEIPQVFIVQGFKVVCFEAVLQVLIARMLIDLVRQAKVLHWRNRHHDEQSPFFDRAWFCGSFLA
jgi:hypothetical protein